MGRQIAKLLNLLSIWPANTVAVYPWLKDGGISRKLVEKYKRNGWVHPVGRGAVTKVGDKVDWKGALYAMQKQLNLTIHPAAKTALEEKGYAHYLPMGQRQFCLMGDPQERLPAWFKNYNWGFKINYYSTNLFPKNDLTGMVQYETESFSISISSPERAILEQLYLVPHHQSFDESKHLMESLVALQPKLVQSLLEQCSSIKTKRLFLFFAELNNHPWLKGLNLKKINLGSGKRVIVPGGKFISKYMITVPKD